MGVPQVSRLDGVGRTDTDLQIADYCNLRLGHGYLAKNTTLSDTAHGSEKI